MVHHIFPQLLNFEELNEYLAACRRDEVVARHRRIVEKKPEALDHALPLEKRDLPNCFGVLLSACGFTVAGVWIEKGMGLIIPGFIPSTHHEIVEYAPSLNEWKIGVGIWAFGMMVYTLALKIAISVLSSRHSSPHIGG